MVGERRAIGKQHSEGRLAISGQESKEKPVIGGQESEKKPAIGGSNQKQAACRYNKTAKIIPKIEKLQ
jgi:hypothetical protein